MIPANPRLTQALEDAIGSCEDSVLNFAEQLAHVCSLAVQNPEADPGSVATMMTAIEALVHGVADARRVEQQPPVSVRGLKSARRAVGS